MTSHAYSTSTEPSPEAATTAFNAISDVESPMSKAHDLAHAILIIAAEFSDAEAGVVCTLAGEILDNLKRAEHHRGTGFHALHPLVYPNRRAGQ